MSKKEITSNLDSHNDDQTVVNVKVPRSRNVKKAIVHDALFGTYDVQKFQNLKSKSDFNTLMDTHVAKAIKEGLLAWVPLGRRPNNLGSVNKLSKPETGVSENIQNALDAWIAENIGRGIVIGCNSAQEVIDKYGPEDVKDLAKKGEAFATVSLLHTDSYFCNDVAGYRDCMTLEIRDQGVGIPWDKLVDTILDFGNNLKNEDPRYIGRYGQGGSTALPMVSKEGGSLYMTSHFADEDLVSLTVVKRRKLKHYKNAVYEYLIDTRTGHPPVLNNRDGSFAHGTRIAHFGYRLHDKDMNFYREARSQKNSFYNTMHNIFVEPLVPFRIRDLREDAQARWKDGRPVYGSLPRIREAYRSQKRGQSKTGVQQPEPNIVHITNDVVIPLDDGLGNTIGELKATWAVAGYMYENPEEEDRAKYYVDNFINSGECGKIYLSGVAVQSVPRSLIREELGLRSLAQYALVYVCLDGLSDDALSSVMTGERERLTEGFEQKCFDSIVTAMREDDMLVEWNEKRKQMGSTTSASESVEKRLQRELEKFMSSDEDGDSFTGRGTRRTRRKRQKKTLPDPQKTSDHPTFIEIMTPNSKPIYADSTFGLTIRTDATLSYLDNHLEVEVSAPDLISTDNIQICKTSDSVEGYGLVRRLEVTSDLSDSIGESVWVSLHLKDRNRPSGEPLSTATIKCNISERPEAPKTKSSSLKKVKVNWIDRKAAEARGMIYHDRALADFEVDRKNKILTVYLSNESEIYQNALEALLTGDSTQNSFEAHAEKLKSEYSFRVSKTALMYYVEGGEIEEAVFSMEDSPATAYEQRLIGSAQVLCEMFYDYRTSLS